MTLSHTLGKTIADFCGNGFHDSGANHCAHFVGHVLQLDTGYDCKVHQRGKKGGACLRVHELFADCPQVGEFKDAKQLPCIVFVTAKSNVNLAKHSMGNIPQKHVGIYDGKYIYHYSNGRDVVVRQIPSDFLARFEAIYAGTQGLYFGTMPEGACVPA
jgi:hypothetical protein